MAVLFKCKMCGGNLEVQERMTVCECEYCGTKQTLPRLDDERRANLYDRANHFRRNNDFDKASSIYERILTEDNTDAEAYWSLVLCRYGVEYVEDSATHKRVPTVNCAQYTSIFDDENYKLALAHADFSQKLLYEEEAKTINEIQKGILAISLKEEPFDIFICYKETDANGRRTQDSVLANDLYHQLTQEGFKVFFSRITLEDKLGESYEPYIFAALNSARVMIVLGTKPEHFNAVWVKNEWSRYLALVKNSNGQKVLIPAYRDMDPYNLPEEFSHLQAQDMSKLGFMQDLIWGIKKIVKANEMKAAVKETIIARSAADVAPLLKRAFMFLEDGEWNRADDFCEQVLNQDPENAQAYLGKLMAELCVHRQDDLVDCEEPFDDSNNYQRAVRFADSALSSALREYIDLINKRNEDARLTGIYNSAVSAMKLAKSDSSYKAVAGIFKTISGFRDADTLADQCLDRAEVCRKDAVYSLARSQMTGERADSYEDAIKTFQTISGWRDSDEQIYSCLMKVKEIKAREEAERLEWERQEEKKRNVAKKAAKKRKKIIAIVIVCIAFVIVLKTFIIPELKLRKALKLQDIGDYEAAYILLEGLDYKDSKSIQNALKPQCERRLISRAQVGSYVFFGSYEQDDNAANGKEDIEWLVLAKEDDRILLISRYALDYQQYNTSYEKVTWETSSLRKWLNRTFLKTAFSEEERAMIPNVTVNADKNPEYDTDPGNSTTDQVFLLSITEANNYFRSDSDRRCQRTAYCEGALVANFIPQCRWWLRSPGRYSFYAANVRNDGSVYNHGVSVTDSSSWTDFDSSTNFDFCDVRPALWINLEF